jgi:cytochrome c peroxidase
MSTKKLFFAAILLLVFSACQKDDDSPRMYSDMDEKLEALLDLASQGKGKAFFMLPESTDFNKIPQDPKNPITSEKVALGKLLFHETGIAMDPMNPESEGTYSCASCHFAGAGFAAGRHQGIGDGGIGFGINGEGREPSADYQPAALDVQPIRTPPALNTAYQEAMLWNGQFAGTHVNAGTDYAWVPGTPIADNHLGYEGVETQAIAGLKVHRLVIDEPLLDNYGYKEMFDAAFPNVPEEDRYSREFAGLAIAAYERTLVASEAPFQQWLRGNLSAMTELEKEGAALFFGKAACNDCHTGPALNVMDFYAIGMKDLSDCPEPVFQTPTDAPAHLGRGGFTGLAADLYKFKVPQLYNLADSPFYGHGSSFRSLRDVVAYKNAAQPENDRVSPEQLAEEFQPLGLTDNEIDAIAAFLESGLHDPNLQRFEPETLPSGLCFPNNDTQSSQDLGCN